MKELISLKVNGELHEFAVEPQTTLLEALREQLKLTGAKEGCGTGECGSCTVLLDDKPILSCLTLAVDCQDAEITTIEGLAQGENLTEVQQSFLETGAVQCGFCTPGMVLTITALLKETPNPTHAEIKKALEGNICRCTGYNKIMHAIAATGERRGV
jgi:aerobic-type carbon monoxide dehydrogenase small subunit (CoxS/CutS family)